MVRTNQDGGRFEKIISDTSGSGLDLSRYTVDMPDDGGLLFGGEKYISDAKRAYLSFLGYGN